MSRAARAEPLLSAAGVRFAYRTGSPVLDGLDLELAPGLTLLVGPNGCGKSTVMRLLAGIERPQQGSIHIAGRDLWRDEVAARAALVYVPEQPELVPYATVGEIVELVASLRGAAPAEVERAMAAAGIERVSARMARELSQGQRRSVLIAAARLADPRVILLDEPLEALDRGAIDHLLAWLDERLDRAAALVISHRLEPFLARASAAATLRDGKLLMRRLMAGGEQRRKVVEAMARGDAVGGS